MPRSLSGRIVLVVVVPLVAAWLAMAVALNLILATLHADATKAALADVGQTLVVRFRTAALDRELRMIVGEIREAVAGTGTEVHLLRGDGTYTDLGEDTPTTAPATPISIPEDAVRGAVVTGTVEYTDGERYLYAASVLRQAGVAGPRAIVLSQRDRSRAEAFGEMVRALPVVFLVGTVVGLPLVLLLVRSVGGPLRRLTVATADLPQRETHQPLPLEGPAEVRDLTDRFNAMAEELSTARNRETALLADLRHDLRTPLTVITGYAAALFDGTAGGDEAIRAARTIGDEAARLERLVDELGAVERLRRGTAGLRPEQIDTLELLQDAAERFRATASTAGIDLAPVVGAMSLGFVADRGAMERIMANLISNALSAAPSPGGHVWLSASVGPPRASGGTEAEETVVLSVTDDGPGFPPGAAARAFERFYRADPARAGTGSGLGLAIVREFALAHGGSAFAENMAPHGARVSVVLPKVPPAG